MIGRGISIFGRKFLAYLFLAVIGFLLLEAVGRVANAQEIAGAGEPQTEETEPTEEPQQGKRISAEQSRLIMMELRALEGAVPDSQYIVGPGDVFGLYFYGAEEHGLEQMVSADGHLFIPTLGSISVAGKTLREVKKIVREKSSRKYKQGGVIVYLTQVRQMRVHVLGEVLSPDTYVATPVDRVGHLIDKAGGLGPWAAPERVTVTHRDGRVDTLNYLAYRFGAKMVNSPFVRDGDVIFVPQIDLSKPVVYLESPTKEFGYFQLVPGETVASLLQRLSYYMRGIQADRVTVLRKTKPDGTVRQFSVNLRNPGSETVLGEADDADHFQLRDGDRVILNARRRWVYVAGAVTQGGKFPYFPGYTVLDYVGMTGVTPQAASLEKVKVFHISSRRWITGPSELVQAGDLVFVPESARRRWLDYLGITSGIASIILAAKAIGVI